ncbi:MAG: S9 family peptidase [Erythrobacter sp.]|nr:S9 family peptidase [Erythrobacter sp.]
MNTTGEFVLGHRSRMVWGAALLFAGWGMPLAAQDASGSDELTIAARQFGIRASVLDVSLSPSGTKIAYITAGPEHTEVINVVDLDGDAKIVAVLKNTEEIGDFDWCEWATDVRLVCQFSGMGKRPGGVLIPFDRLFAVNADGSNAKMLSQRDSPRATGFNQNGGDIVAFDVSDGEGEVLMTRNYIPESDLNTRLANSKSGLGVDLVDVTTGRTRSREAPDDGALRFVADQDGRVRIKVRALYDGTGNLTGDYVYLYRAPNSNTWKRFEKLTVDGAAIDSFTPVAVDSVRNVAFGFIRRGGYRAVVEVLLDGSDAGKLVMARDDVDVDALIRIGRKRRVVGASYATEKREVAYFDPELDALAKGLAKALPDQPLINIVGASSDERRILLIASSDTQPGMVYLFDKEKRSLEPLLPVREQLVDRPMGQMRPVTYPAADGTQIPAYLTLPPGSDGKGLPAIVLPHGGPAARDEWGFDWIVQFLTARGYAVLQPNYRGSAGYGDAWYGRNGFKAWDIAVGDVNDAGRWLAGEGIARPDQLAIVGWSYGGYAALQSQVLDPELFKAVVAIAPVSDLGYLIEDARDYTNARIVQEYVGDGPHVAAGSPRRHAERFAAPVALFHGTRDLNVDVRHARAMEKALASAGKQVIYHEYEDLQHGLEDTTARIDMLTTLGRFLDDSLGRGN